VLQEGLGAPQSRQAVDTAGRPRCRPACTHAAARAHLDGARAVGLRRGVERLAEPRRGVDAHRRARRRAADQGKVDARVERRPHDRGGAGVAGGKGAAREERQPEGAWAGAVAAQHAVLQVVGGVAGAGDDVASTLLVSVCVGRWGGGGGGRGGGCIRAWLSEATFGLGPPLLRRRRRSQGCLQAPCPVWSRAEGRTWEKSCRRPRGVARRAAPCTTSVWTMRAL
jgi:hypothetical protein